MTLTTDLVTQELVQYCAGSHDAFVRKAGERLRDMEAERDEARALLREVREAIVPPHWIRDRIDAALAKGSALTDSLYDLDATLKEAP
jgi:hypothetical protein